MVAQSDLTDTFAYHRRVVKLLGSQRPPPLWLFKAPHHTFHLDHLVMAYPDARFVWTHRDPTRSVPSYASFVSSIFPAADDAHDATRVGPEVSNHLRTGIERAIAARARIGEDRFCDVHHHQLVADPLGTVARVYDHLGLDLAPDVAQSMADWQTENRSGAHGTHRYTPEQFGLSVAGVRADYDPYIRRFDIDVAGRRRHPRRTHMTDDHPADALPSWSDQMKALEGVVDGLLATWRPDGATGAEVQDMNKLALSVLAGGYFCRVYTDSRRPVFMPLWNYAVNQGGPDPDYVYSTTEVDADGVYRISGYRGTTRFVEITQQTFDMMTMGQLADGSPVPHTHDLDDLAVDERGWFEVVLERRAARRPRRRLVAPRPAYPPAAHAEVLV